jgi:hypothetical protein
MTIYELSARECVRLAQAAEDPALRSDLLKMAHDWMVAELKREQEDEKSDDVSKDA